MACIPDLMLLEAEADMDLNTYIMAWFLASLLFGIVVGLLALSPTPELSSLEFVSTNSSF